MVPPAAPRRRLRWSLVAVAVLAASCSGGEPDGAPATTVVGSGSTSGSSSPTDPTVASAPATTTTLPAVEPVSWEPCGTLECATVEVPVDYDAPDGDTLTIALVRRPAGDPGRRIGSLLVNPGGPGASGIDLVERGSFPAELGERFDLVGFDPRGVGRSSPLDCHTHLQAIYDADPTLDDAADRRHLLEVSQDFVDECRTRHGDLLAHMGTVDVARDLDRIREAVGDEQLTYLGYSYGTSIGQQYARLFPDRVRALVLDGLVDASRSGLLAATGQARGFDAALSSFMDSCDRRGCGFGRPAAEAVDELVARAEAEPIANVAGRPATPGVVSLALAVALYSETLWDDLAHAVRSGLDGDGSVLVALADTYLRRNPDGSYPNGFEVYFAVSCLDSSWPDDPDVVFEVGKLVAAVYPRTGEALITDYVRCALWPEPPDPLQPIDDSVTGLPPIVLISTTGDPATPHSSGLAVAEQIPGSVLITNRGEGHTVFGQGEACVDEPTVRYLVDLTVPGPGIVC